VLDEFRLHFTLTNAIDDYEPIVAALSDAFARDVASASLLVDALALFVEERPGEPFRVALRFPFG